MVMPRGEFQMAKQDQDCELLDPGGELAAGIGGCICEKPAGWDALADANWRALQDDMATRKSLGSHSPKRTEG
jgi:hypothetical protein